MLGQLNRVLGIWCLLLMSFAEQWNCAVSVDENGSYACESHANCGEGWVCVCTLSGQFAGICKPATLVPVSVAALDATGCVLDPGTLDPYDGVADTNNVVPDSGSLDGVMEDGGPSDLVMKDAGGEVVDSAPDAVDIVLELDAHGDTTACESAKECDDGEPCTEDRCNPDGRCVYWPVDNPCEDGVECTVDDYCEDGQCKPGPPTQCADASVAPCLATVCDPERDCVVIPILEGEPCDDGNPCYSDPKCVRGVCVPKSVTCDDGNVCTNDSCDPATGCTHFPVSGACDDGNACTAPDVCAAGFCTGTAAVSCDDGQGCTDDTCNPVNGCVYSNNAAVCDDGDKCTLNDKCSNGVCVAGPQANCNDNNPCTSDSCSKTLGCVHVATSGSACSDGNACTEGDQCNGAGVCVSGAPKLCNDNNPCTSDYCNPATGCGYAAITGACNDKDACTISDACSAGICKGMVISCNDGNTCTDDTCNPVNGCVYSNNAAVCNDGNKCTVNDKCSNGVCVAGPLANCNDNNPCTSDSCDQTLGCVYTGLFGSACSDGNACTDGDQCNGAGVCVSGAPKLCNDNNVCTNNFCAPATGCGFANNTAACDDGNPCTENDSCVSGSCKPGAAVQKPGCDTTGAPVCELSGSEGATVDCPLLLASKSAADPLCTALQFTLQFDYSKLQLVNFFDEACFRGVGCFQVAVTGMGAFPLSTGHFVSIGPSKIADWNKPIACSATVPCADNAACVNGGCANTGGFGGVVIVNVTYPTKPISDAVIDAGGNLSADPQFMIARFTLLSAISAATPQTLLVADGSGADANAKVLDITVDDTLIISSKP